MARLIANQPASEKVGENVENVENGTGAALQDNWLGGILKAC